MSTIGIGDQVAIVEATEEGYIVVSGDVRRVGFPLLKVKLHSERDDTLRSDDLIRYRCVYDVTKL